MHNLLDYIITLGYIGIIGTVFAESGLLVGFFLPGDSLLFTAGLLAAKGIFNIWILLFFCMAAAIIGDSVGYYIGNKFGPKIFKKEDSWFFRKQYVEETQKFFEKHGKKTIILARFVPIVRTFAPVMAGVGNMEYRSFLAYNIVGGVLWTAGFLLGAYYLGTAFPAIQHYTGYIIVGIIFLSFIPVVRELWKNYKK